MQHQKDVLLLKYRHWEIVANCRENTHFLSHGNKHGWIDIIPKDLKNSMVVHLKSTTNCKMIVLF